MLAVASKQDSLVTLSRTGVSNLIRIISFSPLNDRFACTRSGGLNCQALLLLREPEEASL